MPKPHGPSPCQCIPCFADGVECGGLTGMERRKDGWMEVDRPALRPTCCLSNALIRFRCEWTWHCDIKEFHSLGVRSSPYCINMPLMFHSDTGLFSCTSPITNGSDKKYTDNDMIVNGIHFWFGLIGHYCGENHKSQNLIYPLLPEVTYMKWKCKPPSKASKYVIVIYMYLFWEHSKKEIGDKPLHRQHITCYVYLWVLSGLYNFMLSCSQLSAFLTMNNNKMTLVVK